MQNSAHNARNAGATPLESYRRILGYDSTNPFASILPLPILNLRTGLFTLRQGLWLTDAIVHRERFSEQERDINAKRLRSALEAMIGKMIADGRTYLVRYHPAYVYWATGGSPEVWVEASVWLADPEEAKIGEHVSVIIDHGINTQQDYSYRVTKVRTTSGRVFVPDGFGWLRIDPDARDAGSHGARREDR